MTRCNVEKRAAQLATVGAAAEKCRESREKWIEASFMVSILATPQNLKREAAAHSEMTRARRAYDAACAELVRL